jgi:DNA-binding MarR family transcriptional regulator
VPSTAPAATLTGDGPAAAADVVAQRSAQADQLLKAMASLRRNGRLLAGRPVELSSLTGSQLELVRLVRRRPGVSVAQAAEELRLAPNTVSTLVRQLTDSGLLLRRVDPADRRVARLALTAGMQRKVDAFLDRRIATLSAAIDQLPAGDRRRLADTLRVLEHLADGLQLLESNDG